MKDPNIAFRMAVGDALVGLTYDGSPVLVYDEKAEDGANNTYVLLSAQTAAQIGVFSGYYHDCSLLLQIITKQQDTVSKDVPDIISEQITNILFPNNNPAANGLVAQSGFNINCLKVESVNSENLTLSATKSEIKKLIRLTAKISQL
jgi:hypothetical protein